MLYSFYNKLNILLRRNVHNPIRIILNRVHNPSSYDSEGKTTATILNHEAGLPLLINSYSPIGFKLNNDMSVIGPLVLFTKVALAWNIKSAKYITPETLTAFWIVEPKIDILVIGVGDPGNNVNRDTRNFLREQKINVEILPTEYACTTFNFLNVERRVVAGAFLPTRSRPLTLNEEALRARIKQKRERDDSGV